MALYIDIKNIFKFPVSVNSTTICKFFSLYNIFILNFRKVTIFRSIFSIYSILYFRIDQIQNKKSNVKVYIRLIRKSNKKLIHLAKFYTCMLIVKPFKTFCVFDRKILLHRNNIYMWQIVGWLVHNIFKLFSTKQFTGQFLVRHINIYVLLSDCEPSLIYITDECYILRPYVEHIEINKEKNLWNKHPTRYTPY